MKINLYVLMFARRLNSMKFSRKMGTEFVPETLEHFNILTRLLARENVIENKIVSARDEGMGELRHSPTYS